MALIVVNYKKKALPSILRRLRREKELTQQAVATALGIKHPSYHQYESGRSFPTPDKLAKLAELFGVSTDYLLGRDNEVQGVLPGVVDALTRSTHQACIAEFNLALSKAGSDLARLEALRAALQATQKKW